MVSAVKEFIFKNWERKVMKILYSEKTIRDSLESHHFVKFGMKR